MKRPALRSVPVVTARPAGLPVRIARQVAVARVALGASLFVAPVPAARLLGLDSGTARRISWLLRMTAARDAVVGGGALTALPGGDGARWIAAGAVCDLADTLVIADAVRAGRIGGVRGGAVLATAAGGVLAGAVAAIGLRRR